jgi:tetratricopeptide (TPR) repeat protein
MATVRITCPKCAQSLSFDSSRDRSFIVCPQCKSEIRIPHHEPEDSFENGKPPDSASTKLTPIWIDDDVASPEELFRKKLRNLLADGILSVKEKEELAKLRKLLGISVDDAKRIFDEEKTIAVVVQTNEIKPVDAIKTNKFLQIAERSLEAGQFKDATDFFNKALEEDPENWHAWFGKGVGLLQTSTLGDPPYDQAQILFTHAIDCAPDPGREEVGRRAATQLYEFADTWFEAASTHVAEHAAAPEIWTNYVNTSCHAIPALEFAYNNYEDPRIARLAIRICEKLIRGVRYSVPGYVVGVRYLPRDLESSLRKERVRWSRRMQKFYPNFSLNAIVKYGKPIVKSKPCFVVTACYGDSMHPNVVTLRTFRDEWLSQSWLGRQVIALYNAIGPCLARLVSNSPLLRRVVTKTVVQPLAALVRRLGSKKITGGS